MEWCDLQGKRNIRAKHIDWFDSFDFIVEVNKTDGGKNANLTQAPENKRLP